MLRTGKRRRRGANGHEHGPGHFYDVAIGIARRVVNAVDPNGIPQLEVELDPRESEQLRDRCGRHITQVFHSPVIGAAISGA